MISKIIITSALTISTVHAEVTDIESSVVGGHALLGQVLQYGDRYHNPAVRGVLGNIGTSVGVAGSVGSIYIASQEGGTAKAILQTTAEINKTIINGAIAKASLAAAGPTGGSIQVGLLASTASGYLVDGVVDITHDFVVAPINDQLGSRLANLQDKMNAGEVQRQEEEYDAARNLALDRQLELRRQREAEEARLLDLVKDQQTQDKSADQKHQKIVDERYQEIEDYLNTPSPLDNQPPHSTTQAKERSELEEFGPGASPDVLAKQKPENMAQPNEDQPDDHSQTDSSTLANTQEGRRPGESATDYMVRMGKEHIAKLGEYDPETQTWSGVDTPDSQINTDSEPRKAKNEVEEPSEKKEGSVEEVIRLLEELNRHPVSYIDSSKRALESGRYTGAGKQAFLEQIRRCDTPENHADWDRRTKELKDKMSKIPKGKIWEEIKRINSNGYPTIFIVPKPSNW